MNRAAMSAGPWAAVLLILIASGCQKNPVQTRTQDFFVHWLQEHGETNIVVDSGGVGLKGNPTRLKATLFGSKKHASDYFVVELDFRIRVAADREIVEFIAGSASSFEGAVDDALLNFALTTIHVVYKAFLNPEDPHQKVKDFGTGAARKLFVGDLYTRSDATNSPNLGMMRAGLEETITSVPFTGGPHWAKLVYSHRNGKPMTVEVTVDNHTHPVLTTKLTELNWPVYDGFYMAKEFMVIK